jgi:hypothetical protein
LIGENDSVLNYCIDLHSAPLCGPAMRVKKSTPVRLTAKWQLG